MLTKMKTALDGGGRVTILVRHAERPALEPGDRTFGASLPLTANGWRDDICHDDFANMRNVRAAAIDS